jgi:hypothetical protein
MAFIFVVIMLSRVCDKPWTAIMARRTGHFRVPLCCPGFSRLLQGIIRHQPGALRRIKKTWAPTQSRKGRQGGLDSHDA